MPKVYLSENERLCDRLAAWVYGQLKIRRIPQRIMAAELGISQSAFAQKLKNRSFSFVDFLVIVRVLNPDASDLDRLLGR